MAFIENMTGPKAEAFQDAFGFPAGMSIVDTVPDEIKSVVHPHWNSFPPINPMWHYLLGMIYIFIGFLAITGNLLVVKLYFGHKNLQTPSNMLVLNLALSDLVMITTNFPIFTYNCFNGGVWSFSAYACELYAMLGSVTGVCSLWSLVFISYDRYNVIAKGMSGTPLTSGMALVYICFCWFMALLCSLPPLFGWGAYIPEGILTSCSFDYLTRDFNKRTFGIAIFVFDYCVPLFVICFAYIFIIKAIAAHEKAMREQAKKMNVSNLRSNQDANAASAEVRIAKVAMTNVALWIICWTPYASITVQGLFFDQSAVTPLISTLPALLAKSASVYNPLVYAINHPKFRLALQKDMPWFCIHEAEAKSSDNTSVASTETTNEKSESA